MKSKQDVRFLTREEMLDCLFNMLCEIHRCCVENNITYYLAYGTLIGAIRHKGFIPWDDDLDIMMTYDEYQKLLRCYKSDRYFIADCNINKKHHLPFPRMYDSETCILGDSRYLGLPIDIYLIHGAPSNHRQKASYINRIIKFKKRYNIISTWISRFKNHLLKHISDPSQSYIVTYMCRKHFKMISRYKYNESRVLFAYAGDGITELFWNDFFEGKPIEVEFEGKKFFAPLHYHEVLSTTYGDYMKLPPEEARKPYHGRSLYSWKNAK